MLKRPCSLQAQQWLNRLSQVPFTGFPRKAGVTAFSELLEALGARHPGRVVVLVGGTNGKGSTCRALEVFALNQGLSVGVYASPHLVSYHERIRLQGKPVTDAALREAYDRIEAISKQNLSFFEWMTAAACVIFSRSKVDLAIMEIGLGGKLDAVNTLEADLSILTTIELDHTQILGDTRGAIAKDKVHIARSHRPLIIAETDPPQEIAEYTQAIQANPLQVGQVWKVSGSWFKDSKKVEFQWLNGLQSTLPPVNLPSLSVATALIALEVLYDKRESYLHALKTLPECFTLPGRWQWLDAPQPILLDVAHNPQSIAYLTDRILQSAWWRPHRCRVVCGALADKDLKSVFTLLKKLQGHYYIAPVDDRRSASAAQVGSYLPESDQKQFNSVMQAFENACLESTAEDVIVACGSFHVVGPILEKFKAVHFPLPGQ